VLLDPFAVCFLTFIASETVIISITMSFCADIKDLENAFRKIVTVLIDNSAFPCDISNVSSFPIDMFADMTIRFSPCIGDCLSFSSLLLSYCAI